MIMRIVLFLAGTVLALAAAGCGGSADDGDTTSVVASFYPLAYAARQVAGPDAEVTNLTAAGVEPHDLELTAPRREGDRRRRPRPLPRPGVPARGRGAVESREGTRIDLLDGLELVEGSDEHGGEEGHAGEEQHGLDPHVWLDPTRYAAIVARDRRGARAARRRGRALERAPDGARRASSGTGSPTATRRDDRHEPRGVRLPRRRATASSRSRSRASRPRRSRARGARSPGRRGAGDGRHDRLLRDARLAGDLADTVAREAGATTADARPARGADRGRSPSRGRLLLASCATTSRRCGQALGCR